MQRRLIGLIPVLSAIAGAAAIGLAGCAPAPAELPDGIVIDLYQTRLDVAERTIEISIANASGTDLTITSARIVSEQFTTPAQWTARPGGSTVRDGTSVDLPVPVPEATCGDDAVHHVVRIDFTLADGRSGTADVEAVDRHGQLAMLHTQDCLADRVAEIVTITAATAPTIVTVAGASAILLPLTITPTGADGSVEIVAIRSTVLISAIDPVTGAVLDATRPALIVRGTDAPSVLQLPLQPGRCDAHVIAEDKQGTVLTVEVVTDDGTAGTILVHADDATRNAIYAVVSQVCGLPAG